MQWQMIATLAGCMLLRTLEDAIENGAERMNHKFVMSLDTVDGVLVASQVAGILVCVVVTFTQSETGAKVKARMRRASTLVVGKGGGGAGKA